MKQLMRPILAGLLCTAGFACTANIHDNQLNIKDPRINVNAKADVDQVDPDDALQFDLEAGNVFLVPPNQAPPAEHANDAGHFQVYLDRVDTPPILVTAELHVNVKLPAGTAAGRHKLIFRLHAHDGRPLEAVLEVEITVTVDADGQPSGRPGTCACQPTPSSGDGRDHSDAGAPDAAAPPSTDAGVTGHADAGTPAQADASSGGGGDDDDEDDDDPSHDAGHD